MAQVGEREVDDWPEMRSYILRRGGMAAGDWSAVDIPGGTDARYRDCVYRARGVHPDVLAVEMAAECPAAAGLWDIEDSTAADGMLAALRLSFDAHQRLVAERGRERVVASRTLRRGERRLAEHIDRLAQRWGDRLDLGAIGAAGEEIVSLYESGERVSLMVGGEMRRATVGCTGTARPEFVYLLSLPVLEVDEVAA